MLQILTNRIPFYSIKSVKDLYSRLPFVRSYLKNKGLFPSSSSSSSSQGGSNSSSFKTSTSANYYNYITMQKIHVFLGNNFYQRLSHVYNNLLQAIKTKNYKYLNASLQPNLYRQIIQQLKSLQQNKYKIKILTPIPKKISSMRLKAKKLKKILTIRQKIWDNGITRIGINCNVYFGECFDRRYPLYDDYVANNDDKGNVGQQVNSSAQSNRIDEQTNQKHKQQKQKSAQKQLSRKNKNHPSKLYKIGQFRYIRYYPHLGIIQNIKNMYNEQTYEIIVKYSSKMRLQIQHLEANIHKIGQKIMNQGRRQNDTPDNNIKDIQIISQIVMRCSNDKFDWVITNINGMNNQHINNIRNRAGISVGVSNVQQIQSKLEQNEQYTRKQKNKQNVAQQEVDKKDKN